MSSLETKISELERELALKRGYQSVKFNLPKGTPEDVAQEIQAKLREVADGLALPSSSNKASDSATFTSEQVEALKMIADTVLKKQATTGEIPVSMSEPVTPVGTLPARMTSSTPAVASIPKPPISPKKARIITTENIRGDARKFAASEEEVYVANPGKVDDHGMVTVTHQRRGVVFKIPVDDLSFVE